MINVPIEFRKYHSFEVNGIRTWINIRAWNARAVKWKKDRLGNASCYQYFTPALLRWATQGHHLEEMHKKLYPIEEPVVYDGHSNGCALFSRSVIECPEYTFEAAHLFAPACSEDFEVNGFNKALYDGIIRGNLYLYCSEGDTVLSKWAKLSRVGREFGFENLGYDSLGFIGPKNVDKRVKDRVKVIWNNHDNSKRVFDHNDWFEKPEDFERSMILTCRV